MTDPNPLRPRRRILLAVVVSLLIAGALIVLRPRQPPPVAGAPTPAPTQRMIATPRPVPSATATPPPVRTSVPPAPSATPVPPPARFFDDQRLNYAPGFSTLQIQAFLDAQPGRLKGLAYLVGDRRHTFAEVLGGQTAYYSVNPQVILALLELHGALVTDPAPSSEQIAWAAGYRGESGNRRGLQAQVRWAVRQILYARRDYPSYGELTYADGSSAPPPPGMTLAEFAIARVIAPSTTPGNLDARMQRFREVFTRLFDDPRTPPLDWPAPAEPFLVRPIPRVAPVTSFFDHAGPFLARNFGEGVHTYWGRVETDIAFAYNGHDGWDYAAAPPTRALAAANGEVIFAGNADDGCNTRAVAIDHGNGYRTLYWHLARVDVEIGMRVAAGEPIGVIGNTGCSTGPHLHFGVQYLGRNVDPYGWCGAGPDPWAAHPAGAPSVWLWADRPNPCGPPPDGAIVVDSGSPGFLLDGEEWQEAPAGYGGAARFAPSQRSAAGSDPWELRPLDLPPVAVWRPVLPAAGSYRVIAYIPYALSGLGDARAMRFSVRHAGGVAEVVVDGSLYANDWVDLGAYTFGDEAQVVVSAAAEDRRLTVWADAIMWLPVAAP
jgi:murein DD-endopeptidase MepM/ murein hydrolase activator NlpD